MMHYIAYDALVGAVLGAGMDVYAPVREKSGVYYRLADSNSDIDLTAAPPMNSPRDIFFPRREDLMDFHAEGKSLSVTPRPLCEKDFIVMGVRACDARALTALDNVYLTDPVDTFYAARRQHGIIITVACTQPNATCFCKSFGADPALPGGDISLYPHDAGFLIETHTEKGERLIEKWALVETDAAIDAVRAEISEKYAALPYANLVPNDLYKGDMLALFDSPVWEKLSAACLGCGACTFVCPACQCYDIRDRGEGGEITRYRCWDSCMYSDFTMMASGTPRKTQKERFRQRFMHKLVYFPMNNDGMYSCVGCGRCVRACPANINILKVIKSLGGGAK